MCSLNMGSMNFGLFPMLNRYKEFKYEWERQHLEASRDFIFRNTFKDIERIIQELAEGCGTRFEFECYDVGHLYNLAHFLDRGLVKPPLVRADDLRHPGRHRRRSGEPGAHAPDRRQAVRRRLSLVDPGRRPPPDAALHDGRDMGGNVRVGLEDSIYLGKGQLAKSNAEQVTRIRTILEELSLEIATPRRSPQHAGPQGRRPGRVLV